MVNVYCLPRATHSSLKRPEEYDITHEAGAIIMLTVDENRRHRFPKGHKGGDRTNILIQVVSFQVSSVDHHTPFPS